jgi:hypothetical protein
VFPWTKSIHDIVVVKQSRGSKEIGKNGDIVLLDLKENGKSLALLVGSFHRQMKEL